MKILYVFLDSTRSQGAIDKVKGKISGLATDGIEVRGIFLNEKIEREEADETGLIRYYPAAKVELHPIYNRRYIRNFRTGILYRRRMKSLYARLTDITKSFNPDYILMRYPLANKWLLRYVSEFQGRIIFEHNTKEPEELESNKSVSELSGMMYRDETEYGPQVLRAAAGIIGVTPEITRYEIARAGKNIQSWTITNGIDFSGRTLRNEPPFDRKNIKLLFLGGSPAPWQGEDLLLRALADYKGEYNVTLDFAGIFPKESQQLAVDLGLTDQVKFHGTLAGRELEKLFDSSHAGIGTLALSRKKLKEAVSLKVREYLSRGLPVVLAYHDSDISGNTELAPFVLQLEDTCSPPSMDAIVGFVCDFYNAQIASGTVRDKASKVISTTVKMEQLRHALSGLTMQR
jgi:glycosyltransferase involved in cell wall biosynthesis